MLGGKKFNEYNFRIFKVNKGKNAWPTFFECLNSELYVQCNDYTRILLQDR